MALEQLELETGFNKIDYAIKLLQDNEPMEGYHLAFSGGKDSIVIYHLTQKSGVNFKPFYNWTGIDPPELRRFITSNYPNVEIRKPPKSIWKLIDENRMLPTRIVRYCCEDLKEYSVKSGTLITGVRGQESPSRRRRKQVESSFKYPELIFVHPILKWSNKEVWQYIKLNNLSYCLLYNEGFERIGCILCPFVGGRKLELEMKRYPKYVEAWRRAANRLYKAGYSHKNFKSGDELFEWWLTREAVKEGCNGIISPKMFFE